MTNLLEEALRKVATLPREEQDAIASQIIETLEDEAAWREKLARAPEKLRRLAEEAQQEQRRGETRLLDELL
jgi:DNA-binding protein H-NS